MASISDDISLRTMSRANSTSVHGNISPLHRAPTPVSSVQPHPDAQEQALPDVGDPDDESETQPSLSSVSTSSNPASPGQGNDRRSEPVRRTPHWKTIGIIIGFNFAGALIVAIEPYTSTEKLDIAVMNPPIPRDLDFAGNETFPTLSFGGFGFQAGLSLTVNGKPVDASPNARTLAYYGPNPALRSIAQSIIIDNRVFNLPEHPGENSTYKLQFRGPQLRCNSSQYSNSIPLEETDPRALSGDVFVSKWLPDLLSLSVQQHNISDYSISRNNQNITVYEAHVETTEQACIPKSVFICFVAAIIFAGIAIYSLSRNGTPAADGGFLQIMTATRGNTEMERLVLRQDLTNLDKLPLELRSLKVRYGELVGAEVPGYEGRFGFGTAEETIRLRKRK
ncbi:uncharacterized protein J4E84_009530 [Alternaria hordeiaustralica]|uniref:uncharacterized protein n=1 Tax=Alternaria hordeiaustralica TaxID=1187925 RepID=UPI0020C34536|nr:uncharacterized protein J4E84_009530 [Alternaria hordeiaustralica]KAI4676695.1 hypothetical protein J4E84_009530 [Alternaria hordeiaustralica]